MKAELKEPDIKAQEENTSVEQTENSEKTDKKSRKKLSKQFIALCTLLAVMVILNIVAWESRAFSDFYAAHIYPLWTQTYGRLTSLLPFSFGEILIMIAVFGIPLSLAAMVILLIVMKGRRKRSQRYSALSMAG